MCVRTSCGGAGGGWSSMVCAVLDSPSSNNVCPQGPAAHSPLPWGPVAKRTGTKKELKRPLSVQTYNFQASPAAGFVVNCSPYFLKSKKRFLVKKAPSLLCLAACVFPVIYLWDKQCSTTKPTLITRESGNCLT